MAQPTLLFIDDDDDFNTLIKVLLEQDTSWSVLTAYDGMDGINKANLKQPSIIFLDIVAPRLNGIDVYFVLKSNPITASIPIVFLTSMPWMKPLIQVQITEEIEIISKPFNMMSLKNQIIDICDRYLATKN